MGEPSGFLQTRCGNVLREEQHATLERLVRRLEHEVLEGQNGKPC